MQLAGVGSCAAGRWHARDSELYKPANHANLVSDPYADTALEAPLMDDVVEVITPHHRARARLLTERMRETPPGPAGHTRVQPKLPT